MWDQELFKKYLGTSLIQKIGSATEYILYIKFWNSFSQKVVSGTESINGVYTQKQESGTECM